MATGENRNGWGNKANTVFNLIEEAVSGFTTIAMGDANVTLTATNGASDQSRQAMLRFTGANTAARTVTIPAVDKMYVIDNATTGGFGITISNGSSSATIPASSVAVVTTDGSTVWTNSLPSTSNASLLKDIVCDVTAGGTANAITLSSNSKFTSLANGRMVAFIASADSTSAVTLNVNGLGAKAVRQVTVNGDAGLVAGEIQSGGLYIAIYNTALNGAAGGWLLINPEPATTSFNIGMTFGGSATGVTFSSQSGLVTKKGNVARGQFVCVLTSNGSGSGAAEVTGLPFTCTQSTPVTLIPISGFSGMTGTLVGYAVGADTRIILRQTNSTGSAVITDAEVTNTAAFYCSFNYQTSD
jgi:hypothetical protein